MPMTATVTIPSPHAKQREFIDSPAKRKVVRAGRRGGKTVGMAIISIEKFLQGYRVLYAAPTQDQIDRFFGQQIQRFLPIRSDLDDEALV